MSDAQASRSLSVWAKRLPLSLVTTQGNGLTRALAKAFFIVALIFVFRSFYGMRIKSAAWGDKKSQYAALSDSHHRNANCAEDRGACLPVGRLHLNLRPADSRSVAGGSRSTESGQAPTKCAWNSICGRSEGQNLLAERVKAAAGISHLEIMSESEPITENASSVIDASECVSSPYQRAALKTAALHLQLTASTVASTRLD